MKLGVDHIDLCSCTTWSAIIEWEFALREDGALEAAVEAREEGLIRFIGVTGHGLSVPAMHRRSSARFDSVLLPYNFRQMQDERYAEEFEALAAVCAKSGVAIEPIESMSRSRLGWSAADGVDLVQAAHGPGGYQPRSGVECSAATTCSSTPSVTSPSCRSSWRLPRRSPVSARATIG